MFCNNTEREALKITAHPQYTIECLNGQLKGIGTKARFTPYSIRFNAKHSSTPPPPSSRLVPTVRVALLFPLKRFYFTNTKSALVVHPRNSFQCNLVSVDCCADKCLVLGSFLNSPDWRRNGSCAWRDEARGVGNVRGKRRERETDGRVGAEYWNISCYQCPSSLSAVASTCHCSPWWINFKSNEKQIHI